MVHIYVLKDPITNQVRYIGKTTNPERRLRIHISNAYNGKSHCKSWLISLIESGLTPVFEIIDFTDTDGSELEMFYIRKYKELGCDLCNHTIGGECGILSQQHINNRVLQVKKAIDLISSGNPVLESEMKVGLSNGYLYKVRKGEIAFLSHIQVPYFRNLKKIKGYQN